MDHRVSFDPIGEVGGSSVNIEGACDVDVMTLSDAHHRCLESIVGR